VRLTIQILYHDPNAYAACSIRFGRDYGEHHTDANALSDIITMGKALLLLSTFRWSRSMSNDKGRVSVFPTQHRDNSTSSYTDLLQCLGSINAEAEIRQYPWRKHVRLKAQTGVALLVAAYLPDQITAMYYNNPVDVKYTCCIKLNNSHILYAMYTDTLTTVQKIGEIFSLLSNFAWNVDIDNEAVAVYEAPRHRVSDDSPLVVTDEKYSSDDEDSPPSNEAATSDDPDPQSSDDETEDYA
jgi:hypothetical protein